MIDELKWNYTMNRERKTEDICDTTEEMEEDEDLSTSKVFTEVVEIFREEFEMELLLMIVRKPLENVFQEKKRF